MLEEPVGSAVVLGVAQFQANAKFPRLLQPIDPQRFIPTVEHYISADKTCTCSRLPP